MEDSAALAYILIVASRCGESEAIKLADEIRRINAIDGVEIRLETSDDDPLQCTANIYDPLAAEWCDAHGALDGGTWESVDGPDFAYDILYWHPGQIEELQREGYDFDFSNYCEPSERDIEIAKHVAECPKCEYDWHSGEEHLEAIEREPLFHQGEGG